MRQIAIVSGHGRPVVSLYGSAQRVPPTVRPQQQVEEPAEREPRPYMTYLLTGINLSIFLWMMAVGRGNIDSVAELFGAKVNVLIQHGQWWRLLTPVFLHGSWLHLLSNSLSLIWFGGSIERLYGARKYLMIYFVAGVMGNIASYMHSPALSLGASGAIFGLVGAGLMFPIRFRSLLPPEAPSKILGQIVPIAAINLFIGQTTPSIDNWAHMGGLVGGAMVALFLIPDALTDRDPPRIQDLLLSIACVAALLITLLAGFLQWNWARKEWKAASDEATMVMYTLPTTTDPWWHVGLPKSWKPVDSAQAWTGPNGLRLDITDSVEDPRLLDEVRATSQQIQPNIKVDGHPGWQIRAKIDNEMSDVFFVPIYGRVIELVFHPSDYANIKYVNLLEQIIHSVHFDHAPADAPKTPTAKGS